jgi:hypothetical protein
MDAAIEVLDRAEQLGLLITIWSSEEWMDEPYMDTRLAHIAYENLGQLEYINTVKFYKGNDWVGTALMSSSKDYEPEERVIDYSEEGNWITEVLDS